MSLSTTSKCFLTHSGMVTGQYGPGQQNSMFTFQFVTNAVASSHHSSSIANIKSTITSTSIMQEFHLYLTCIVCFNTGVDRSIHATFLSDGPFAHLQIHKGSGFLFRWSWDLAWRRKHGNKRNTQSMKKEQVRLSNRERNWREEL